MKSARGCIASTTDVGIAAAAGDRGRRSAGSRPPPRGRPARAARPDRSRGRVRQDDAFRDAMALQRGDDLCHGSSRSRQPHESHRRSPRRRRPRRDSRRLRRASAKLAAEAGFGAVLISGYCLSATRLGEPDVRPADADRGARRGRPHRRGGPTSRCSSTSTPATATRSTSSAPCASWCGSAPRAASSRTRSWPKRCGHMEGKRIVPLEEYLAEARGARARPGGPDFWITARTGRARRRRARRGHPRAGARSSSTARAACSSRPRESVDEMARVRAALPAERAARREHGRAGEDARSAPPPSSRRPAIASSRAGARRSASAHALRTLFATLARDGATRAWRRSHARRSAS